MSDEVNEELAIQYAMARRQRPFGSAEEIAEMVLSRLSEEEQLVLASDALLWNEACPSRRDLARQVIVAYVHDIEAGGAGDSS